MRLKPVGEQVAVVLGASSGIGRETALRFAQQGAKVVVAARGEPGLTSLAAEITAHGGEAAYAVCDVTDFAQVEGVAEVAVRTFGRIDTWVNVAAVGVVARFEDTSPEEFRRVMEVTFMGQVHGAKAALPHLRRGGALISIASVESIAALPLHSAYAAAKHAVEGMIDALRRELLADWVPISVTSVKPATINTPFFTNARNKMEVKSQGIPPFYQPSVVADCVLYAAEHPVRDVFAGGAGKLMALNQMFTPGLLDAVLGRVGIPLQRRDEPEPGGEGNLYAPNAGENRVEGDFSEKAVRFSPYTWVVTHPKARVGISGGVLAATGALLARGHDGTSGRRAKTR